MASTTLCDRRSFPSPSSSASCNPECRALSARSSATSCRSVVISASAVASLPCRVHTS
jgi:hypothetical protein